MKNFIKRRARALADRGLKTLAPLIGGIGPQALTQEPHSLSASLTVPNPFAGAPLCTLALSVTASERVEGEHVRLRAHLRSDLRLPRANAPALAAPDAGNPLVRRGSRGARKLLRRGLESRPVQALAPLLERRINSWIDIQASTAPYDRGARALLPETLASLGISPDLPVNDGMPRIEIWQGPLDAGRGGVAQIALLEMEEPGAGSEPLQISALIATTVEPGDAD